MHPSMLWWERLTKVSLARKGLQSALSRLVSETLFRELLAQERLRSERSGNHYRVLLVYVSDGSGVATPMKRELSGRILAVLSASLRKTDQIGWYREGKIMGALLTHMGSEVGLGQCRVLVGRLNPMLQAELPDTYESLRLNICTPEEVLEFDGY